MRDSVSHEKSSASREVDSIKWEILFYEDILKRCPNYVEVLMLLGTLYTGNKMYAKGMEVDRRLASLKKDDPIVHYNLACSYSLLNQADKAFESLKEAFRLGYCDADHMATDTDLDRVRSDPRYAEMVDRMRRARN